MNEKICRNCKYYVDNGYVSKNGCLSPIGVMFHAISGIPYDFGCNQFQEKLDIATQAYDKPKEPSFTPEVGKIICPPWHYGLIPVGILTIIMLTIFYIIEKQ